MTDKECSKLHSILVKIERLENTVKDKMAREKLNAAKRELLKIKI